MTASLKVLTRDNVQTLYDLGESGFGYYGATGFGASVPVGEWHKRTFITNGSGTVQGPEVNNFIFLDDESGEFSHGAGAIKLTQVPNYMAPFHFRFEYDTPVNVQNAQLRIYDRVNPDNPPSGVDVLVAEVIHPDTVQNDNGSGDPAWLDAGGLDGAISFSPNPGSGGNYAGDGTDSDHLDTIHDWFAVIAASPQSVGSKTQFGMLFSTEYL